MDSANNALQDVLAIVGPTASGKSALSMALAEAADKKNICIELISMDSALVYKGMDIGTAKPSLTERTVVTHHGIDICQPWETYSAANFAKDAHKWAQEIKARGNVPVIIGGTMLYWRALTQGLTDLPPADPLLRKEIEDEAKIQGWEFIHARLAELDPITANRLPAGDTQRVQRALEIILLTGKPMSELIANDPYGQSRDAAKIPHHLVSLEPIERSWLHERIARRFNQMLDEGFIEEMKRLMSNPEVTAELPSMRAVGYRQGWEYLSDLIDLDDFRDKSIAATRQLAKRQLTWLRAMPSREVFDPSRSDDMAGALKSCLSYLEKHL
jgi:tRNA dimethylallyltransferase